MCSLKTEGPCPPSSYAEDLMLKATMVFGASAREWVMWMMPHDGISDLIRRHPEEYRGSQTIEPGSGPHHTPDLTLDFRDVAR